MPVRIALTSITLRTMAFAIAWYVFSFISVWLMMTSGDDMAGAIWSKAVYLLFYPFLGLWFIIDIILSVRKIAQHRIWKILGLYCIGQILCSPFIFIFLTQLGRWLAENNHLF